MLAADSAAVECDLAEIYGILDYRQLPARRVAVFACGLGHESRIGRKMSGAKASDEVLLLAVIADTLRILAWQNTVDGVKGRNRPKSITETILADKRTGAGFSTSDEFEAWRARMIGDNNGE